MIRAYLGEPIEDAPDADRRSSWERRERAARGQGPRRRVRQGDRRPRRRPRDLHEGEVVALLGPNGAGKTTTILTLAGDLTPLGGAVRCLGLDNNASLHQRARCRARARDRRKAVFTRMTVAENLRVFRTTADAVVELFPELEAHLDRRVALLSGGQQQMLALGLALSRSPAVILADELSMGLAPMVVDRLFSALRTAADRGAGVLLVEQHVHKAMTIADRIYVMDRGRISITGHGRRAAPAGRRDPVVVPGGQRQPDEDGRRHGREEAAEEALPRLVVGHGLTGAALHQQAELQRLEEERRSNRSRRRGWPNPPRWPAGSAVR